MLVVSGINFSKKNLVANQQRKNANATRITQLGRQTSADTFQPAFKANIPNLFNPIEKEAERLLKYIDIENNPYDYARMVVKETKRHPDQVNIMYELAKKMRNLNIGNGHEGFFKYDLPNNYEEHHLEILKEAYKRKPDITKVDTNTFALYQPEEIIGLLKKGFIENIDSNLANPDAVYNYNYLLAGILHEIKQYEAEDMIRKSTINYFGEKLKNKYPKIEKEYILAGPYTMNCSRGKKKDLLLDNLIMLYAGKSPNNELSKNEHLKYLEILKKEYLKNLETLNKKGINPHTATKNDIFKEILRLIKENYGDYNFADCKKMLEELPD